MLDCKDFVLESAKLLDEDKMHPFRKFSFMLHLMICSNCRKYFKQIQTTHSLAANLDHEPVSDKIMEESILRIKAFTDKKQD